MIKNNRNFSSRRISDGLVADTLVLCSDEDQLIVNDLIVGFNVKGDLIVALEQTDYECRKYDCCTYIRLCFDEAHRLAKRLDVEFIEMPRFISDCMAEWRKLVNPTLGQVEGCFKEISDCLLDEGCHFSVRRLTASDGSTCC